MPSSPARFEYQNGTGTPKNDPVETLAIRQLLGPRAGKVPVYATKSMIGHLVGAAGIASALAALGGIRDQVISPTANLRTPDPECDLDYVPNQARKASLDGILSNTFGFGGQNGCVVFRRAA